MHSSKTHFLQYTQLIKLPRKLISSQHLWAVAASIFLLHPVSADVSTSEFERALDLIEQTQLEIFIQEAPKQNAEVLRELNARFESSNHPLKELPGTSREVAIMRELLSETIDQFKDQYANYISPEQLKTYGERRSGSYVGVGLKFRSVTGDYPLVIGPLLGGPLENSNIHPGDRLVAIDEFDLKGSSTKQIKRHLKGAPDTTFMLTVERKKSRHTVSSKRRAVDLHYARSEILRGDIGYIKISRFGGKTHERVETLLVELIGSGITSIILDLRDNPGGSTRAARATVSMFSDEPYVYCEKYKSGEVRQLPRYGAHLTDLPLAVLVNGESKSSAEIVAGALQGHKRGLLIGSPTFGKGLVQRVFRLADPIGGALRTTIARFGSPGHGLIHDNGIVPDITIETKADFMFRESGSLNIDADTRAYQRLLLERQVRKKYRGKDSEQAARLIAADDKQLQTAIDELTKISSSMRSSARTPAPRSTQLSNQPSDSH